MFQGSLPHSVIKVIATVIKEWDCKRIYVGCSGNFTIERSISNIVKCPITSNDVTVYSSYIGKYFAGDSLEELKIRDSYEGDCKFLSEYMYDDTAKIATLILASDILSYDGLEYAYAKRMLNGYKSQFARMHKEMYEKMKNVKTKVDTFYHGDVMDMLDTIDEHDGFLSFPPFFKGGYEKMWKRLEGFFEYKETEYKEFDPTKDVQLFCEKVKNINNFVLCMESEIECMSDYFLGQLQTNQNKTIYLYGKSEKTHYVKKHYATKAKPILKISKEDKINENISIREIKLDQFNENRALYLSTLVTKLATPSVSYGLFCDNKMFGIFAFSDSFMLTGNDKLEKPVIYLLTDFAISPTCEKNLSKLVLYCVLSKETQFLAQGIVGKRMKSIATNAFSKHPVSMKYRGLFELYNRREVEKDKDGKVMKYNLSYGAAAGQWTLKEGYKLWRQKS